MGELIRRYPVGAFVVLAYAGSWIAWSPWWLSRTGVGVLDFELPFEGVAGVNQLGLFAGPFAAAVIVTRIVDGRGAPRRILVRLLQWREHPCWYVLSLVAIPVAVGAGYLAARQWRDGEVVVALAGTYLAYLLGGPLQEEPGWRGFAQPRLQQRFHPLVAGLLVGVLHCGWHAPLFLTREWDTARQDLGQLVAYLVLVVAMAFVMAWLVNGSHGSLLLAMLGHNSVNWTLFAAPILTGTPVVSTWPAAIGMTCLAVVAIVVTRGRLASPPVGGRSVGT